MIFTVNNSVVLLSLFAPISKLFRNRKFFQKLCSLLCNFSLFLNIFLPYFAVVPVHAIDSSPLSTITYNDSTHKLNISKNSSDDIPYQLFYKSASKIDSIAGSNLPSTFYLGTCSSGDCLSQNFDSAILKIKTSSSFYYYYLTLKDNQLNTVKEGNSSQFDLTDEENSLLENGIVVTASSLWTFEKVELNKEYIAPQNSGVKLTFTKLPESSGNIKIQEITLTPEQIAQTGSLSDKAYDITSDMADGTFAYNLSLPIPEFSKGKSVDIKFAENISEINTAKTADNTTETASSVSATNLDHFTIFIATYSDPSLTTKKYSYMQGETVYVELLNPVYFSSRIVFRNNNNNVVKTCPVVNGYTTSCSYTLLSSDFVGTWNATFEKEVFGSYLKIESINFEVLSQNCSYVCPTKTFVASHQVIDVPSYKEHRSCIKWDWFKCKTWGSWENGPRTDYFSQEERTIPATYKTETFEKAVIYEKSVDANECLKPSASSLGIPSWALNDFNNLSNSENYIVTAFDGYYLENGICRQKIGVCTDIKALNNHPILGNNEVSDNSTCTYTPAGVCPTTCGYSGSNNIVPDGHGSFQTCAATEACYVPVCGNEIKDPGEECENGSQNGQVCDPGYNNTCNYCSTECKIITVDNLDKIAPSVPENGSPNNLIIATNNFDFNWNASTDNASPTITYEFQSSLNPSQIGGVLTTDLWHSDVLPSNMIHSSGAPDGIWYWQVRAIDVAGNKSAWSEIWQVTLDTKKPPVPSNLSYSTLSGTVLGCNISTNQYNVVAKWSPSTDTNFSHYEYKSFNPTTGWVWNGGNIGNVLSRSGTLNGGEGTYGFAIRAVDKAGNFSDWTSNNLANSCQITYDITAPTITISSYSTALTNQNITVNASTNEGTLNTTSYTFTSNESFTFIATDAAGNVSTKTVTITNIDKTAPVVTINSPDNGDILRGSINVSGSVTDDNPHHYYFVVKKLNGSVVAGPGTVYQNIVSDWNWDTTKVPDGTYIIDLEARDAANNKDTNSVQTITVIVDNTIPSSTIDGGVNNGKIYSNSWNGLITGTATDNLSGVNKVLLSIKRTSDGKYYSLDDGWIDGTEETTRITTTGTTTWNFTLPEPLEDIYTIKSHAIDNAGNTENTYTLTIVLDKTIPEINISLNPVDPDASNGWYKTQPTITLTATDTNFDKIEYQWNSQSGPWTSYTDSFKPVNEGSYVLYYRAVDKANNFSDIGIKNIKWDQTDPEYGPQNISANPNPTSGSTSKIKWELAKDNIGIDKYEVQWSLNGKNYSKTLGAGTTEVEIDSLTEGNWNVKVVAFDQSGRGKEGSINLQVDRTGPSAPTLALTATSAGTATLSWNSISDATDYIIWYGNTPGSRIYGARVGNVTSYTVRGLGAGNYYFIVKAVDAAQNQGAESNEVNTGVIAGAAGVAPGTPAQGFTPQVLGATETTPSSLTGTSNGEVLGVSNQSLNYLWWLLLILPISFILWLILKKKRNS